MSVSYGSKVKSEAVSDDSGNDPSVWLMRFWKTGARFSAVEWAKKASPP